MKIKKTGALLAILVAMCACLIPSARADAPPSLSLDCTAGDTGEIVTLTLAVSDLGDTTDGDVVVTFDADRLQYVDCTVAGLIDEAAGGLSVNGAWVTYSFMMNTAGQAHGDAGVLAVYRFRVKEPGVCAFACSAENWIGDAPPEGFTYRKDLTDATPTLTLDAVQTGRQVLVTLTGEKLTGLLDCDLLLRYDPSILSYRDAQTAELDGIIMAMQTEKADTLYLGVAGEEAWTTDTAVLAIFTFDVTGGGNASFALEAASWEGLARPRIRPAQLTVTYESPTEPETEPAQPVVLARGDVDGDGRVTARDARLTLRCSARLETFTEAQLAAARVTGGDTVTARDARRILRVSARLETFD